MFEYDGKLRDKVDEARRRYTTRLTPPDPLSKRTGLRKAGSIEAFDRSTGTSAGSLSYSFDADVPDRVTTTQFTTQSQFRKTGVALLLAVDLAIYYGVSLHHSHYSQSDDGVQLIESLIRWGVMTDS